MADNHDQIRDERSRGECLGPLVDKHGADAVVSALGIPHVAASLGVWGDLRPTRECPDCEGEGGVGCSGGYPETCDRCGGRGVVTDDDGPLPDDVF